jgi:hypothetical protein
MATTCPSPEISMPEQKKYFDPKFSPSPLGSHRNETTAGSFRGSCGEPIDFDARPQIYFRLFQISDWVPQASSLNIPDRLVEKKIFAPKFFKVPI